MKNIALKIAEDARPETLPFLWGMSALRFHYYGVVLLSLLLASTVTGRMVQSLDQERAMIQMTQNETVECLNQLQDLVGYLRLNNNCQRAS